MKHWPMIIAGLIGAVLGFLSTVYVGMAVGLGTSLTATATVVLLIICPVIYAIWLKWWLVPIHEWFALCRGDVWCRKMAHGQTGPSRSMSDTEI